MATGTTKKTEVGSYFIANYPPFSQWTPEGLSAVRAAMNAPPLCAPGESQPVPLGLYLHIPFCRKRCKFCYFRVYTDKNSHDVEQYVAALSREIELVSKLPVMGERPFRFVERRNGISDPVARRYSPGSSCHCVNARLFLSFAARVQTSTLVSGGMHASSIRRCQTQSGSRPSSASVNNVASAT